MLATDTETEKFKLYCTDLISLGASFYFRANDTISWFEFDYGSERSQPGLNGFSLVQSSGIDGSLASDASNHTDLIDPTLVNQNNEDVSNQNGTSASSNVSSNISALTDPIGQPSRNANTEEKVEDNCNDEVEQSDETQPGKETDCPSSGKFIDII